MDKDLLYISKGGEIMERLTIDEAIALVKIERECVIRADVCDRKCEKCDLLQDSTELIDMYKQIAEWLRELKDYREKNKMVVRIDVENMDSIKDKIEELSKYAESQYNKALDDFVHKVKEHHYVLFDVATNGTDYGMFTFGIEQIAEELKEQK